MTVSQPAKWGTLDKIVMKKRVGLRLLMIKLDIIASKLRLVEKDTEISPMSFAKNHMVVLSLAFIPLKKVWSHIMTHNILLIINES